MLINALSKANETQRKELEMWIANTNVEEWTKENWGLVTALYNAIGIDVLAQEKINFYFEESKKYLAAVPLSDEIKKELTDYVARMMKRNY